MTSTTPHAAVAPPAGAGTGRPAERLLHAATKLFADQGIRAVGVDQLLREAGVAKASLYGTFGSKDALVTAYLRGLDHDDRNRWIAATTDVADPVAKVLAFFDLAAASARARDFRGCLYANAASEYPGVDLEPVRAHRAWLRDTVTDLLVAAGIGSADAAPLASDVQLIYDGALLGSKLERDVAPIAAGRRLVADRIAMSSR